MALRATQVRPAHAARLRGAVPHVRALRLRLVQPRQRRLLVVPPLRPGRAAGPAGRLPLDARARRAVSCERAARDHESREHQ